MKTRMITSRMFVVFLCLVLSFTGMVLLTACSSDTSNKKPLENVEVRLKWIHQAQFAGNYVALDKRFYESEGMTVKLIPYTIGDSYIDAVVSGKAQFGIAGADEIIIARSKGVKVQAIAVIYKTSPVCAYSLKSSGIVKPQDFINKTVGIEMSQNVEYLYSVMMSQLKINRSKIREVSIGYDAEELLNGTTDVSTGYIINEPQQAIEAGYDVNIILDADYGANMYADVLFTSDRMVLEKPELVKGFVHATIKGWQYSIENLDEAVNITLRYATTSTRLHQTYMLKQSIPLINNGKSAIGVMDDAQWIHDQDLLFSQGLISKKTPIGEFYTNSFIE